MTSQDDESYGCFLLETVASIYACNQTQEAIDRAVFKNTECGAWCRFDEDGILVGTIVEGHEPEYSERIDLAGIQRSDEGAELLAQRFRSAIERCESFVDEVLAANDPDALEG